MCKRLDIIKWHDVEASEATPKKGERITREENAKGKALPERARRHYSVATKRGTALVQKS